MKDVWACASRSATRTPSEPEALTQIFAAFAQTKTGAAAGGTGWVSPSAIISSPGWAAAEGQKLSLVREADSGSHSRSTGHGQHVQGEEEFASAVPRSMPDWLPARAHCLVVDDSTANRRILASARERWVSASSRHLAASRH